jgi:antitoxin ParD1/3/4
MPKIDKVSIALPTDMLGEIRAAVETGEYATTSEVVREALRDWRAKRRLQQAEIEELRRLIREGDESGPSIPADEVMARLHQRYG